MGDFSHLNKTGEAAMVDISAKSATQRTAVVTGRVHMSRGCVEKLSSAASEEIIRTARIAGIQAAKQTAFLIPLCHQVPLAGVDIDIELSSSEAIFALRVTARTAAATGVEMETLCAASVAGLTIYDMIKAVDPAATVGPFQLVEKQGGKNGTWTATQTSQN